jgi:hypothetical protein
VRQVGYLQEQISVSSSPIEGTWGNKAVDVMFFEVCIVVYTYNKNQQNAHFSH